MERIQSDGIPGGADGKVGAIAVAGNVTVYTMPLKIAFGDVFCLSVKATKTAGNVDVDVSIEQGCALPTAGNENAADSAYVLPEGFSTPTYNITDENWHHIPFSPAVLPYLRWKLAGDAGNHASVTLDMKLSKQEGLN